MKSEKELKKKGRDSSEELMGEVDGTELSCVRWFDNRAVPLLSTFTGQSPVQKAKRSSSAKKEFTDIDFPDVVQKSNKHMGGVYLFDSLLGLYRIHIRSKKWYFRIITHMLDLSVVAAWLLYRRAQAQLENQKVLALAEFKAEVAESLTRQN
ncbi:hypothetical protein HPB47_021957, partial [Ixodes persulcatus]